MKPTVLGIVIVLALLAAGAIFYGGAAFTPPATEAPVQTYANDGLGIAFAFPVGYLLSEEDANTAEMRTHTITLIREADAVPVVAGGEGPTAITVSVLKDATRVEPYGDVLSVLQSSNTYNFQLGDGTYERTTVDGADAVHYTWSGLYEGESTAFIHNGQVMVVSVTYMSPSDQIRMDYFDLLSSFRLH